MQKLHEAHPVELLLLAGLALLWALMTSARLLVPAVALLLTLAGWRPAAPAAPVTATTPVPSLTPAAPVTAASSVPPLTAITLADLAQQAAATLEPLTVAQLRQQARTAGLPRSVTRSGRRDALLSVLAGIEVAMA